MGEYRIYHVSTAKIKPGKGNEAVKWWREKGKTMHESIPGAKSVRAYVKQFGLGGEYGLEVWIEVEDYAAYDRVDEDVLANPQKYAALRGERLCPPHIKEHYEYVIINGGIAD